MVAGETETIDLPGTEAPASQATDAGLVALAAEPAADLPRVVELGQSPLLIGRDPPPGGLRIAQSAVSKLHAQIVATPGGFVARDLGSRNGLIVQGRRVQEARLAHGDLVHIGNALFKFVAQGARRHLEPGPRPPGFEAIVGGPALDRVIGDLALVARTDLSVLLLGETGTGKEVFARSLHAASGRPGRFVALNCAAIPTHLLEAELFGVRRGAYTGADRDREGLVRAADRGTLLLDEIGDMPLEAQVKVLRLIETREVVPLGATVPEPTDARLVCATHRDLRQLCREGKFRGDLLARVQQHAAHLPPLRDRKEDLPSLVDRFLIGRGRPDLRPDFRAWLVMLHYDWPFNVRELEAVVRRAVALARDGAFGEALLPEDIREVARGYGAAATSSAPPPPAAPVVALEGAPTRDELDLALRQHQGNVAAVGRHYGKDRAQVHRWLRRHGLIAEDYRG